MPSAPTPQQVARTHRHNGGMLWANMIPMLRPTQQSRLGTPKCRCSTPPRRAWPQQSALRAAASASAQRAQFMSTAIRCAHTASRRASVAGMAMTAAGSWDCRLSRPYSRTAPQLLLKRQSIVALAVAGQHLPRSEGQQVSYVRLCGSRYATSLCRLLARICRPRVAF
jgi:hypothetical protein